ncbi:hypothetical protein QTN25_001826 [Entamoeba marina]
MPETRDYLQQLSQILELDKDNQESIINNSLIGIEGEEDSVFKDYIASVILEKFIALYSLDQLNHLYSRVSLKYFDLIVDSCGSRVFETIFHRYETLLAEASLKIQTSTITLIIAPFVNELEKKNQPNTSSKYDMVIEDSNQNNNDILPEVFSKSTSSHALVTFLSLISPYIIQFKLESFITDFTSIVLPEGSREIDVDMLPLAAQLLQTPTSPLPKVLLPVIVGDIPITDPNWSIMVEAALPLLDKASLLRFEENHITKESLVDTVGNHVVQTFLNITNNPTKTIELIMQIFDDIAFEYHYHMLIASALKNVEKADGELKDRLRNRICSSLQGRGSVFEEGRVKWNKSVGRDGFIDFGYAVILEELIKLKGVARKELCNEFVNIKRDKLLRYCQHTHGSHVVEVIIEYATDKSIVAMWNSLRGYFSDLVTNKFASHVIEKLFLKADMKGKTTIASELVEHYRELEKDFFARKVLSKLKIIEYRDNKNKWIKTIQTKEKIMKSFKK